MLRRVLSNQKTDVAQAPALSMDGAPSFKRITIYPSGAIGNATLAVALSADGATYVDVPDALRSKTAMAPVHIEAVVQSIKFTLVGSDTNTALTLDMATS